MKKFLKDLEKELIKLKMSENDIKEILEDHKEMIEAATKEGLDEKQLEDKFGNPKKLAKDILGEPVEQQEKEAYNFDDVNSCVKENTEDYNLVKTFPVISDNFDIEINLVSDDVSLTTYEGESIQVFEIGVKEIKDYIVAYENGLFTLREDKSQIRIFSFSSKSAKFLVLVPENANIDKYNYQTVSGDAEINGISLKEFKVKTTSGDIEITNLESADIKVSSVSGDLEIINFKGDSFEASSVSGDAEVEKGVINGLMYFHSVSGDIEILEVECNEASLKTVSGDLEGKEFYPNEVVLKSVSGDIDITNADKSKEIIITSKKTVSGDINIR